MDSGQLKHEQGRQEKLDLERTVSHMYDLARSRRRRGRSLSWYPCTWSPKSSRRFVSCVVVPRVLGCRSRPGVSLVSWLPSAVSRRPVDHRTSALPTSATPHDLDTDSTDRPPVKKTTPSPLDASAARFCSDAPTNTTFYSRCLARNYHIPLNTKTSLQKALDLKGTLG